MTIAALHTQAAKTPATQPANANQQGDGGFSDALQAANQAQGGTPATDSGNAPAKAADPHPDKARGGKTKSAKDDTIGADGSSTAAAVAPVATATPVPAPAPQPAPVGTSAVPTDPTPDQAAPPAEDPATPQIAGTVSIAIVPSSTLPRLSLAAALAAEAAAGKPLGKDPAATTAKPTDAPTKTATTQDADAATQAVAATPQLTDPTAAGQAVAGVAGQTTKGIAAPPAVATDKTAGGTRQEIAAAIPDTPAAKGAAQQPTPADDTPTAPATVPKAAAANPAPSPIQAAAAQLAAAPKTAAVATASATAPSAGRKAAVGSGVRVTASTADSVARPQASLASALQAQEQGTSTTDGADTGSADQPPAGGQQADSDAQAAAQTAAPGAADPNDVAGTPALAAAPAPLLPVQSATVATAAIVEHKAVTVAEAEAAPHQASSFDAVATDAATPIVPGATSAAPTAGAATGTAQAASAGPNTPATLPAVQVAMAITRSIGDGTQSFTMQLHPEKLGAVDVKLDVDAKGRATATFVADRPETLALLRQDAHHLVKSLNDAGVSADAGSLNFSLRGNAGGGFSEAQERRSNSGSSLRDSYYGGSQADDTADTTQTAYQNTGSSRLYDIRA